MRGDLRFILSILHAFRKSRRKGNAFQLPYSLTYSTFIPVSATEERIWEQLGKSAYLFCSVPSRNVN